MNKSMVRVRLRVGECKSENMELYEIFKGIRLRFFVCT